MTAETVDTADTVTPPEREGPLEESLFWEELSQQWTSPFVAKLAAHLRNPAGRPQSPSDLPTDDDSVRGTASLAKVGSEGVALALAATFNRRLKDTLYRESQFTDPGIFAAFGTGIPTEVISALVAHALPGRGHWLEVWAYGNCTGMDHVVELIRKEHGGPDRQRRGDVMHVHGPLGGTLRVRKKEAIKFELKCADDKAASEPVRLFWEGAPLHASWSPNAAAPELNWKLVVCVGSEASGEASKRGEPSAVLRHEFRFGDARPKNERGEVQRIFFSYARKDVEDKLLDVEEKARRLRMCGFDVCLDTADIPPGVEWEKWIGETLRYSDWLYLFWSANAADSAQVARELDGFLRNNDRDQIRGYLLDRTAPPERLRKHNNFVPIKRFGFPNGDEVPPRLASS